MNFHRSVIVHLIFQFDLISCFARLTFVRMIMFLFLHKFLMNNQWKQFLVSIGCYCHWTFIIWLVVEVRWVVITHTFSTAGISRGTKVLLWVDWLTVSQGRNCQQEALQHHYVIWIASDVVFGTRNEIFFDWFAIKFALSITAIWRSIYKLFHEFFHLVHGYMRGHFHQ